MDDAALTPPTDTHPQASRQEQIRDVAMKCFAEHGIAGTSLRMIAETAGVSLGLLQHYYVTKHQLIDCIDRHVLSIFSAALDVPLGTGAANDPVNDAGSRFAELMSKNPDVMDYVGRALAEGGEVGKVIFDGFYAISAEQGATFAARGLTPDDLDPVWANMLPLILRVGTIMLRPHIERHMAGSLYDPAQTSRWDAAVTRMIQKGQLVTDDVSSRRET
ncbi:TetR family transcriptional regulator [Mycobacterium avium subsp. hominissuis]|uniref:TetR family transcriptional regulator n=1 Tax=Mycobacterium avium TaxID=1764 RepID=UPI0026653095|nr:TetR family transcriptional regulator [Mycobacterium avium]MDO2394812.1 TetR family transcriptional regulator [Mycobacterium avium subsp. hominissuis]